MASAIRGAIPTVSTPSSIETSRGELRLDAPPLLMGVVNVTPDSFSDGGRYLEPEAACRRAWELIDQAACRGLKHGGAIVSEKHCNFLINTGMATAADLEALGEEVRRRVAETTGVWLVWEICRLGRHAGEPPREATP